MSESSQVNKSKPTKKTNRSVGCGEQLVQESCIILWSKVQIDKWCHNVGSGGSTR
jgi:hypothetical protein